MTSRSICLQYTQPAEVKLISTGLPCWLAVAKACDRSCPQATALGTSRCDLHQDHDDECGERNQKEAGVTRSAAGRCVVLKLFGHDSRFTLRAAFARR
jgi:hypothetical protein